MVYHQRLTKEFVVTENTAVWPVSQEGLAAWEKLYASHFQKLGNVYIFKNKAWLLHDVGILLGGNSIDGQQYYIDADINTTLTDLGKDLFFGTSTDSTLARARLVKLPESSDKSGNSGFVGYVPIESNSSEFFVFGVQPYFEIAVARV